MDERWHARWSRRGRIAAAAERPPRVPPEGMISFVYGDPDWESLPLEDMALAAEFLAENQRRDALGYQNLIRPDELNEALAEKLARDQGMQVTPEQILVTLGSSNGLGIICDALLDPGDVVLVPDPGYPIYAGSVHLAGAELFPMPLRAENDFLPDLEAIPLEICKRAKLMILNYPNNPVSATAPLSFFEKAVAFAKQHDILVLHDLAYSEMAFDGYRPQSFLEVPGAKDVAIEFNSFSKSFNMAGCRIAYAAGNADYIKPLAIIKSNIDYGVFLAVQEMAIAALQADMSGTRKNETSRIYQERRDVLLQALREIGWDIQPPKATMFVWAPVPAGWTSREFAFALLEKAGVVVIPGDAFGQEGEGYVRIALVQDADVLQEVAARIDQSGILVKNAE